MRPLCTCLITSGQIQDIDPYRCWQNIGLTLLTLAQRCLVSGYVDAGIFWDEYYIIIQESCDPSSVLVCSDLHFCLTSFII